MLQTVRNPILVTGAHRSGTTWVGNVINTSREIAYIHEPFNKVYRSGWLREPVDRWYPYINSSDEDSLAEDVNNLIRFRYPLKTNLRRSRSVREVAKCFRDASLALSYRGRHCRPLIKDPLAFMAAEWLYQTFGMSVVVMIRHPAAFCSSLKIKGWVFPFEDLENQPELIAGWLAPYASDIRRAARGELDVVDQGILLWNCVHHVVRIYMDRHPSWCFVSHEGLSRDPIECFRLIFQKLDLEFCEDTLAFIILTSGSQNPVEQTEGNEFRRNSAENIYNWKHRLEPREVSRIRDGTAEVAASFYSDKEW